jgi:copper chaperone
MEKLHLKVEGLTCGGCEKSVRNALLAHEGVGDVVASHKDGTVDVQFDAARIQPALLKQAIEDAGFDVTG